MGFFSTTRALSKEPPETWTPDDVKAWAKSVKIPKAVRRGLAKTNGAKLMAMEQDAFEQCFSKRPSDAITSDFFKKVNTLKQEGAHAVTVSASGMTLSENLSVNVLDSGVPEVSSKLLSADTNSVVTATASRSVMTPRSEVGSTAPAMVKSSVFRPGEIESSGCPKPPPPQLAYPDPYKQDANAAETALHDCAAELATFVEGDGAAVKDLADFLQPLERYRGLLDLCKANSASGRVFSAIYTSYQAGYMAESISKIASRFQDFCLQIIGLLECAGRRQIELPPSACAELVSAFTQACKLFEVFSRQGWFLHLAFMDNIKGKFDVVHDRAVGALTEAGLPEKIPGRALHPGDYMEPSRALRRVLKQLGNGSIADGVKSLTGNTRYQADVAMILDVDQQTLADELSVLPHMEKGEDHIDLASMYAKLNSTLVLEHTEKTQHEEIFNWYDDGNKKFLDLDDLGRCLRDLGMLDNAHDRDHFVASQMSLASHGKNVALTLDEFSSYYGSLVLAGERHQLRSKLGLDSEEELKHQFTAFANFGNHGETYADMDGAHFVKFCVDCGVVDRRCNRTDVDLTFAAVKDKGVRRISFDQFLRALSVLAEKKGQQFVDLVSSCLKYSGPVTTATKADNIRLHDDKSTYTGVYARGGPKAVDGGGPKDLSEITNRKPADSRGVSLAAGPRPGHTRRSNPDSRLSVRSPMASQHGVSSPSDGYYGRRQTIAAPRPSLGGAALKSPSATAQKIKGWDTLGALEQVFVTFAVFGKGTLAADTTIADIRMDGKAFSKLMKEAGVMDSKLNLTRVDLCYTKSMEKGTRRMNYEQFRAALQACAEAKGDRQGALVRAVERCQPLIHGTVAGHVKLHDDRSTYTGVYAKGGPSVLDKKINLQDMVDRQTVEYANRRQSMAHGNWNQ